MKKLLLLIVALSIGVSSIFAQTKRVTGTVTSTADGAPIPGVSVVVKGTTTGTTTNIDGVYTLNAPENQVLIFSFMGMKPTEVRLTGATTYNVTLEPDMIGVDEVMVVAYGTQAKGSVVGAVSSMRGDEKIEQIPISSLDKALQGNVAGVVATSASGQPGGRTQVRIRGIGSMSGSNEPLYVIDGVPVIGTDNVSFFAAGDLSSEEATNPLANINPNDIESISVLKDAAASALYGARAANGVIIITTKRGQEGKTRFTFSAQTGFSQKTTDNYNVLNKEEYEMLAAEAIVNGLGWSQEDADDYIKTDYDTDWYDVVYREPKDAMTYNAELSARGGNARTQFFVSGSYFKQNGHVLATDYERYASRINLDHTASDKIKFGANLSISFSNKNANTGSSAFASPILAADLMLPNKPIYNEDGSYNNNDLGMLNNFNPVGIAEWDRNAQNEVYFIGQAYAQYSITKELKFKTTFNSEIYNIKEEKYQNGAFGDGRTVGGRLQEGRTTLQSWTSSNIFSWAHTFGTQHNVDALAGFEAVKNTRNGLIARGEGLPEIPKFRSMAAAAEPQSVFSNLSEWSMLSYLSQVNYNYANKYYVSGSIRRDGHSRFGTENKYGNFWSAAGSWRISEEDFMQDVNWVDNLKLRASYGVTGNAEVGDYSSQGLFSYNGYVYGGSSGASFIQYANPALTWEKSKVLNFATDFTVFNRISTTVEYYIKRNSDFLFDVPVSATTGMYEERVNQTYTATRNLGDMENRGIEVSIRSDNFTGDFRWTTDFNFAHNTNEIISLPDDKDLVQGTKIRRVGEDFQTFYLRKWAGVNPDDGTPQWYNEAGEKVSNYSDAERQIVGSASPDFEGGITNIFAYKGFEVSALFTFAVGHSIYDNWAFVMESDGAFILSVNQSDKMLDRWQEPGDITNVPQMIYGGNNNSSRDASRYLHDADYLRLKNLKVSYNLPKSILTGLKLDEVKFFAQGQNLATWTKYPGKDPEVQINGVEDWFYPPLQTITFGVTVGF